MYVELEGAWKAYQEIVKDRDEKITALREQSDYVKMIQDRLADMARIVGHCQQIVWKHDPDDTAFDVIEKLAGALKIRMPAALKRG